MVGKIFYSVLGLFYSILFYSILFLKQAISVNLSTTFSIFSSSFSVLSHLTHHSNTLHTQNTNPEIVFSASPAKFDDRIPDLTFFFGMAHPEFFYHVIIFQTFVFMIYIMMIKEKKELANNNDRILDLNLIFGHPPRMMIGFLTSLSFWVTRQK